MALARTSSGSNGRKRSSSPKEQKKPVFLLVHKTWCGACKQLKNSFKTSPKRKEFVDLSRKFVMVNLEDDEEPEDDKYAPDGRYIPRLYFVDENEEVLPIDNKKNYPRNAYYFPQLVDVIKAMKQALKIQKAKDSPDEEVEAKSSDEKPKKKKSEKAADEKKPKEEGRREKENEKPKKTEKKAEKKTEKPKEKEAKKKTEDKKETEKKKTDQKKSDKKDSKDAKKDEKSKKTKKADKKTEL
ncbi:hypothetical protein M3Y99_00389400 [Aphelenchoides fujianensis]|nr:hypothetical protein M3Y99_00389400 [Aphelenchoides fujianensis]